DCLRTGRHGIAAFGGGGELDRVRRAQMGTSSDGSDLRETRMDRVERADPRSGQGHEDRDETKKWEEEKRPKTNDDGAQTKQAVEDKLETAAWEAEKTKQTLAPEPESAADEE